MGWLGARRRRAIRSKPFPKAWDAIMARMVPVDSNLDQAMRLRLRQLTMVFIGEKYFEGVAGMAITDEVRVTIAANACVLMLGIDPDEPYPQLRTIIVYPTAYVATGTTVGPGGVVTESRDVRAGESWHQALGLGGPVVLAWDEVVRSVTRAHDGHHVVYHEFAHQLDGLSTGMDGAPPLGDRAHYAAWARVLSREFSDLRSELRRGHHTDIDAYAATNPAEFFAVTTEVYFEQPQVLRAHHRALYDQLHSFYRWAPDDTETPIG